MPGTTIEPAPAPAGSEEGTDGRLRIAYAYRSFSKSGSIASLYRRNAERLARDEDVTCFCSAVGREPTSAPLSFERVEPVVRGDGRVRYALEYASFAVRAARALDRARSRFDVVHVDGLGGLDADLVTVHAARRAELEHYFSQVEPRARLRRRLSPYLFRPQVGVALAIERSLLSRPRPPRVLCPSEAVKADLERIFGLPGERVEVVPYGIDTKLLRADPRERTRLRHELGVDRDRLVLLLVGDDLERKGLRRAIAGLARSSGDAELWVIGGSDLAPWEREARAAGVGDRVRLLGRRPLEELPGWYAASDVVLLPSRQDSWGLTVPEGLAAGRPVVASEFSGSHVLIEPGRTGFVLTGSGEPEEIASLIDGPLADARLRRAMGLRAPETVAHLDVEEVYRRFRAAHHRAAAERAERGERE